jgi:hypothetical protein
MMMMDGGDDDDDEDDSVSGDVALPICVWWGNGSRVVAIKAISSMWVAVIQQ